jgi:hypothetical protein
MPASPRWLPYASNPQVKGLMDQGSAADEALVRLYNQQRDIFIARRRARDNPERGSDRCASPESLDTYGREQCAKNERYMALLPKVNAAEAAHRWADCVKVISKGTSDPLGHPNMSLKNTCSARLDVAFTSPTGSCNGGVKRTSTEV